MNEVLEKYFNERNLLLAYNRVLCWTDRLVKDRIGLRAFGANLNVNLVNLSGKLISGEYQPQPGFKFFEPKASGTQRTKTLLMIEDALVFQAIANVIAEYSYDKLHLHEDFVFGSVLVPETKLGTTLLEHEKPSFFFFKFWKQLFLKFKESVVQSVEKEKTEFKFETDITGFFDSIPHYNLFLTLSEKFGVEDEILDILSDCLNIWSGTKYSNTPGVGIPQGPNPSYLLANLLLYPLDEKLISDAYRYYRYMDDIKIYGYSREELENVLVTIDNYLKGIGLSLNSKKTQIERIEEDKEDATVKELKKLTNTFASYDLDDEEPQDEDDDKIGGSLFDITSQTPEGEEPLVNIETLTDEKEIIQFWENEIALVEKELPELFDLTMLAPVIKAESTDIDFIRLSAKYGVALRSLNEFKEVKPNESLLIYWLYALDKFYWRTSYFLITLSYYKNNDEVKSALLSIYEKRKNFEWVRYHVINNLNYLTQIKAMELRLFFKWLKEEESDLVKYAIYTLIIKHSESSQLLSSLKLELAKEKTLYLKYLVLNYWRNKDERSETMVELFKSVGL